MEEKKQIINYDQAKFSLAMIDFKTYTEVLLNIDKQLEEANYVLNYVLKHKQRSEELREMLNEYAFVKFAEVRKYLKQVKKNMLKYEKQLKAFLQENPKANKEFNEQLNVLIPLFEEKEKFIDQQIKKCFDYSNSLIVTDTTSV